MAAAKGSKEVTVNDESTAVTVTDLDMEELEGLAGGGLENVTASDMSIPFLAILQKGSPECDEALGEYIDGAKPGVIINTVNKRLYSRDRGILFVPCSFQSAMNEWTPREAGGGLVASHPATTDLIYRTRKNEKKQDVLPNGNILVLTAYHYGIILDEESGTPGRAVIGMTSTQLKKSRAWNSIMAEIKLSGKNGFFTPPTYSHKYRLTTVPESNNDGNWMGWKIENEGLVNSQILKAGREFAELVSSGAVQVSRQPVEKVDPDTGEVV